MVTHEELPGGEQGSWCPPRRHQHHSFRAAHEVLTTTEERRFGKGGDVYFEFLWLILNKLEQEQQNLKLERKKIETRRMSTFSRLITFLFDRFSFQQQSIILICLHSYLGHRLWSAGSSPGERKALETLESTRESVLLPSPDVWVAAIQETVAPSLPLPQWHIIQQICLTSNGRQTQLVKLVGTEITCRQLPAGRSSEWLLTQCSCQMSSHATLSDMFNWPVWEPSVKKKYINWFIMKMRFINRLLCPSRL